MQLCVCTCLAWSCWLAAAPDNTATALQEVSESKPGMLSAINRILDGQLASYGIHPGRTGLSEVELLAAMKMLMCVCQCDCGCGSVQTLGTASVALRLVRTALGTVL